ncbi:MAG: metallophosphoesterase [Novosphingobium sp.]
MMLRPFSAALLATLAASLAGCATAAPSQTIDQQVPRTAGPLEQAEGTFRFAIFGDRTGAHRPGVFADAMRKLDLMKPDFVISVGDLVEGYTEDEAEIRRQWNEVEARLAVLDAPVFFIAGNHDYSNAAMARIWKERRGSPYWSFVHDGVLFLGLSTEDPPVALSPETLTSSHQLEAAMARAPEQTQARLLDAVRERGGAPKLPGAVAISKAQVEFVRHELGRHRDVRWTLVVMHKPAWQYDSAAFAQIEEMLADRPYTVVAGHEHYYTHEVRNGRDYIVMGTTGGVWLQDGPGRVDHVAWVTMTEEGPVIANIRTDRLFPKEGPGQPTSMPDGGAISSGQ